jgi:hypothetical protein
MLEMPIAVVQVFTEWLWLEVVQEEQIQLMAALLLEQLQ